MLKRISVLLCAAVAMLLYVVPVDASAETETADVAPEAETADVAPEAETTAQEEKAADIKYDVEKPMVRGKTVYYADRGLILPLGTGEARVDLYVGLNKGSEGRIFGVGSGLAGERTSGLTFRGTLWGPFEMGMSLQYLQSMDNGRNARPTGNFDGTTIAPKIYRGPEGDGTRRIAGYGYKLGDGYNHLVPAYLYGRFKVVEQFGVEIGLAIPTMQADGFNRPTLRFGFPVQWIAVPGLLKLHVRPDLLLGFGTTDPYDPAMPTSPVNVGFFFDAGITLSVANFFIDVTMGYGVEIYPYKKGYVPLSMLVGYQILTRLDVYAGFTLDNMTPSYGGAGDARSLTTGIQCRF